MLKNVKIKSKIAMILAILALIVAIANFFIKNETVNLVIYSVIVIVLGLDILSAIEDVWKYANKANDEFAKRMHTVAALENLRFNVNLKHDSTLFTKKEVLELIDETIEDITWVE